LFARLREEFVRIYSEPVMLRVFKRTVGSQSWRSYPALPALGTLDIRHVLSSPYIFALFSVVYNDRSPLQICAPFSRFAFRFANLHSVFQICIPFCKSALRFPDLHFVLQICIPFSRFAFRFADLKQQAAGGITCQHWTRDTLSLPPTDLLIVD